MGTSNFELITLPIDVRSKLTSLGILVSLSNFFFWRGGGDELNSGLLSKETKRPESIRIGPAFIQAEGKRQFELLRLILVPHVLFLPPPPSSHSASVGSSIDA